MAGSGKSYWRVRQYPRWMRGHRVAARSPTLAQSRPLLVVTASSTPASHTAALLTSNHVLTRLDAGRHTRPNGFAISAEGMASMLDHAARCLSVGDLSTLDDFMEWLCDLRRSLPPDEWRHVIADVIRQHPVIDLIHEEPFTARGFQKPRGYAGDAPMLDLLYGEGAIPVGLSPLGRLLYMWIIRRPAARSVRFRCDLLAATIDDVARSVTQPRILSVACGHLREALRSYALRSGAIAEIVAVDQDVQSLDEIKRACGPFCVTPCHLSVRQILGGSGGGDFDLVYSAGLYDYLADRTGVALTRALFERLRPHGRLLIGNFAPSLVDIGYMEAIMDWHLTYRDEDAMRLLTATLPSDCIASIRTFRDIDRNVVYLEARRT